MTKHFATAALAIAFTVSLLSLPAVADAPAQLPDHDGKPADQSKPIRVFVMLGQSNMLGFGRVGPKETKGSLEFMSQEKGEYPYLVDDAGNWIARQDVRYVHVMDQRGVDYKDLTRFGDVRNEWLAPNESFGPELGFGQVMGYVHDEPLLLLKACIGNRSLGWDLVPPGSERFEHEGKISAGYKDVATFWDKGTEPKPVPWYAGRQYDADVAHAKAVLKNLEKYYPGYKGQGFEVTGFVWWQGHKDQNAALSPDIERAWLRPETFRLSRRISRENQSADELDHLLPSVGTAANRLAGQGIAKRASHQSARKVPGDAGLTVRHDRRRGLPIMKSRLRIPSQTAAPGAPPSATADPRRATSPSCIGPLPRAL
jgi:hypothetical protein